jgi:hypothetical protein
MAPEGPFRPETDRSPIKPKVEDRRSAEMDRSDALILLDKIRKGDINKFGWCFVFRI